MDRETRIRRRFQTLEGVLDERMRRLVAAAEAHAIGYGGITAVARATGVSCRAIAVGLRELEDPDRMALPRTPRIRRPGAGRKKTVDRDPLLSADLGRLVEPLTPEAAESPLRWTCKSVRRLALELRQLGHHTGHRMVAVLLHELGYTLQAKRKTLDGIQHPDRNAQFAYLHRRVQEESAAGNPVLAVETRKQELHGNRQHGGRAWRPHGHPEEVRVHDVPDPEWGHVQPDGDDDRAGQEGWVSVGIDHDTAALAVASLRRWWHAMGKPVYPHARRLLITADAGGSDSPRLRVWKRELQTLADELGVPLAVCYFPPGTSKWHTIEHRLFSSISQHWGGKPLVRHDVVVNLIAGAATATGLRVDGALDHNGDSTGRQGSNQALAPMNLVPDDLYGDWNYCIYPSAPHR
jgi:hypothetical protein